MACSEAWLAPDGETVILRKGAWKGSFPLAQLDDQIRFYRRLSERKGGRYCQAYASDLAALEGLKRRVERGNGG